MADHHAKRVATAAAVAQAERSALQAALDAERWALEQEEQEQEEGAARGGRGKGQGKRALCAED